MSTERPTGAGAGLIEAPETPGTGRSGGSEKASAGSLLRRAVGLQARAWRVVAKAVGLTVKGGP